MRIASGYYGGGRRDILNRRKFKRSIPPRAVIRVVGSAFLSSAGIVRLSGFSCKEFVIIDRSAAMYMFSFPGVLRAVRPFLSLGRGSMYFALPLLGGSEIRFGLGTVSFLDLPTSRDGCIVMRQATTIDTSVRKLTIFLCFLRSFLKA